MGFEPVTVLSHWQLYERLGLYEPTYLSESRNRDSGVSSG